MEENCATVQQKNQERKLWNLTCAGKSTFSSSCKLQFGTMKGDWREALSNCLHVSVTGGLNPRSRKKWSLTGILREEHNEGQWSKHEGKNKNVFRQHRVILSSCWSPPGTVALKQEGCTEIRADNPVRASSRVLLKAAELRRFPSGPRKEREGFIRWILTLHVADGLHALLMGTGHHLQDRVIFGLLLGLPGIEQWELCDSVFKLLLGAVWSWPLCCTEPHAPTTLPPFPYMRVYNAKLGLSLRDTGTVKWNQMWERACRHCLLLICKSLLLFRKRDSLKIVLHYCVWSLSEN